MKKRKKYLIILLLIILIIYLITVIYKFNMIKKIQTAQLEIKNSNNYYFYYNDGSDNFEYYFKDGNFKYLVSNNNISNGIVYGNKNLLTIIDTNNSTVFYENSKDTASYFRIIPTVSDVAQKDLTDIKEQLLFSFSLTNWISKTNYND